METQTTATIEPQKTAENKKPKSKKLLVFIILFVFIVIILIVIFIIILLNKKDDTQTLDKPAIEEIFSSFDPENKDSFNRAEELVDLGPAQIPALIEKLKEDDIYTKWASLYALSRLGYNSDDETKQLIIIAVKEQLGSEAQSIQIMSGGILVILGDKEGIPILIEGFKTNEQLLLTEPPQLICQYSSTTLEHYLQQSFGNNCSWESFDQNAYDQWKTWWEENKNNLIWNDEKNLFETNS